MACGHPNGSERIRRISLGNLLNSWSIRIRSLCVHN
jgi:hypothetical protein